MFHHFAIWLFLFNVLVLYAKAQDTIVVVDKETGTPIREVNLTTDKGAISRSNYRGQILVEGDFKSATLSHASYLTRVVKRVELKDTLWLLPRENRLSEVVVWGTDKQGINAVVASAVADLPAYAPQNSGVSFDFYELIRKKPLSRKARKKNKELLKNWDEVYGK
jgi:hypothetical protein